MKRRKLCVAIPASVVSDTPHLREKTSKIGSIGRAAAIFGVDEIIIYSDSPHAGQRSEMDLISLLLAYMETPQYLRTRLFKLEPRLQYAGILPPLRTPHHPLNRKVSDLKVGEYREGIVLSRANGGFFVDIGVEKPLLTRSALATSGPRVTVKIIKVGKHAEAELADRDEVSLYWGYSVSAENRSFGSVLKKRGFGLVIATSRYGSPLAEIAEQLAQKWKRVDTVLVAFGAPSQGLAEIVSHERLSLSDVADFVVNTIPLQGTETVRTEEALLASLAAISCALEMLS
ncbi:RNA methyltransferase [Candidatus Bathyarchaeota archaeon]|nr:RNA methyltransferase [Candidatus Bathyarchaeota archaeon]